MITTVAAKLGKRSVLTAVRVPSSFFSALNAPIGIATALFMLLLASACMGDAESSEHPTSIPATQVVTLRPTAVGAIESSSGSVADPSTATVSDSPWDVPVALGRVNTSVWICATLSAWKSQNLNTNA